MKEEYVLTGIEASNINIKFDIFLTWIKTFKKKVIYLDEHNNAFIQGIY